MIRRLLVAGVALILLVPVGGWFWLGSDHGRQWLAATATKASDGTLKLQGLAGHPLTSVKVESLSFKSDGLQVSAESLTLSWRPWRLLFGELAIATLNAEKITVHLSETETAEQSEPPALPALIARLDSLAIGELLVVDATGTQNRVSDIRIEGLLLSESLAGRLQAHHAEADLALLLAGSPAAWSVTGEIKSEQQGRLGYALSGRYLQQGEAQLEIDSDAGQGRLQALWQKSEQALQAEGEMQLQADGNDITGKWQLSAPANFSGLQLHLQAILSSKEHLGRQMPLEISAALEKGSWSGMVEEQGHGLRLAWQLSEERLQGALTFEQWDSPLKQAAGRLSGRLNGMWRLQEQTWLLKGDIDQGELAGVVASLKLDGQGDAESWNLRQADLRVLGLDVRLGGSGDRERFQLSGRLAAKDIGPVLGFAGIKGAAGRLQSDIKLSGGYDAPEVSATGHASALSLDAQAMQAASFSIRHASGGGAYRLAAVGLSVAGSREVEKLDLQARRQADNLSLDLSTEGRLKLKAKVAASIKDLEHVQAAVSNIYLGYDGLTLLEAERLPLRRDGDSLYLAKSTFRLLGAKAVCNLDWTPESIRGRLDIPHFSVTGKESWLKDSPFHVAGHVGLSLALAGKPSVPTLAATITSPALKLRHAKFKAEAERMLVLSDVRLGLDYRKQLLSWQLQAAAPAGTSLKGSGKGALLLSLQPWRLEFPEAQRDSGTFSARLGRLSELQPLLPRIDPFEGSGSLDLRWIVPPTISSIKGNANIAFDAIGVPEFGLEMKGRLQARLEKGRPFVDLSMQGGDGDLRVQGPVDIDLRIIPDIRFNRFPLIWLPDQRLSVSGAITASERQQVSLIKGELEVAHLRLEIPDPVPGPTEDLQWKEEEGQQEKKGKTPLTEIDIDLSLGNDAEIYGRGMSLKPKGKLHLGGSLSQPKLTGVLEMASGKIEFRSVKLDILAGSRVVFSGDPKRPAILVRAARKVGDITAGVIVEGPADQLSSRLFSEPSMSDAEVLSYVATGRPLASLGKDKAGDMLTAAEFILGPGTMMQEMQGKVQQATGLDVFEVSGDATGGQVKAGRKLSEDITVTVEQTVSKETTTALTLEYMLTRSVSVFARQTMNMAPKVGLRYSKEWFGSPEPKGGTKKVRGE